MTRAKRKDQSFRARIRIICRSSAFGTIQIAIIIEMQTTVSTLCELESRCYESVIGVIRQIIGNV